MGNYQLSIERAILSSILFSPNIFEEIVSTLKSDDFLYPSHKLIFEAMNELYKNDLPIDVELIKKRLSSNKSFDEQDLIDIISTAPFIDIDIYVSEIKDASIKRELQKLANSIHQYTQQSNKNSTDILDVLQAELYKITQESSGKDFKHSKEIVLAMLNRIKELKARGTSKLVGLDTGFKELNNFTTGFNKGDLIIVAARPAMGKTAFVLNIAQKVLDNGHGVAMFSLEMPAEQLLLRMISAKTSLPLQDIKVGNLTDPDWERMIAAADDLAKKPLFIDDGGILNIYQLRAKLRKLKLKHPEVSLAIIDYLQLMTGGNTKERHLEISEISRGLKLLARELDIPIIALSQLNRSLEQRSDKRPMLSDLRESGAIEQDADIILFVYRDAVYKMKEEKEKEEEAKKSGKEYKSKYVNKNEEDVEIIIGKQRNGPIGTIHLIFHKHCTRFTDKHYNDNIEVVFTKGSFDIKETKIEMPTI